MTHLLQLGAAGGLLFLVLVILAATVKDTDWPRRDDEK